MRVETARPVTVDVHHRGGKTNIHRQSQSEMVISSDFSGRTSSFIICSRWAKCELSEKWFSVSVLTGELFK